MRLALASLAVLLAAPVAHAQSVVERARIGHALEDVTVVRGGPLDHQVVALDGYDLVAIPVPSRGASQSRLIADLRAFRFAPLLNGIAWIETEKAFAISAGSRPDALLIVDGQGRKVGERPLVHPAGYAPVHLEALAWIPKGAPAHAERLALVAHDDGTPLCRIEIVRPDGVVESSVLPASPLRESFILGLEFMPPDRLVATTTDNVVWTLGLDGSILAGPVRLPESDSIEGLARLADGDLVAADRHGGILRVLTPSLERVPEDDVALPGHGLASLPRGLAWDSVSHRLLVLAGASGGTAADPQPITVQSFGHDLVQGHPLAALTAQGFPLARRMSFIPSEQRAVVAHQNGPRALLLLDRNGAVVEQVPTTAAGRAQLVEWIPATREFALRTLEGGPRVLRFISRTGALTRTLDLTSTGIDAITGVACFDPSDPSGGRLLVSGGADSGLLIDMDLNGVVRRTSDYRGALNLPVVNALCAVSTGPLAGAFAAANSPHGEIVVFRME